jgi:putative NIF3 family GTP cyclohydrolase 1 type 2
MIDAETLARHCNELLSVNDFNDYCPNGLQVAGTRQVRLLVSGVTASQALLDAALELGADAILVHHGWFWKGEAPCLVGIKGRRVRTLMVAGSALLAYHLPLDAHAELGNNRRWQRCWASPSRAPWVLAGCSGAVGSSPHVRRPSWPWRSVSVWGVGRCILRGSTALCRSWPGAPALPNAISARRMPSAPTSYISGEVSEQTAHEARELGIHYLAAGHHATERYGVQALGAHLARRFALQHHFIDIDNPV